MKNIMLAMVMVLLAMVFSAEVFAEVPPVSGIRQCTLCDGGQTTFSNNPWLLSEYPGKVVWIAFRAKDATTPRQVFIAGVGTDRLIVHNQRLVVGAVDPIKLANSYFGAKFYKFGAGVSIPATKSTAIETVGLMLDIPLLTELPNPAKVVTDSGCSNPYQIDRYDWENIMPAGSLFFKFDSVAKKVTFGKRDIGWARIFDCVRGLMSWLQIKDYYATGPLFYSKDGVIGGEVINANPPPRFAKKVLGDCQNDYGVSNLKDLVVTVERSAPQSTSCFLSLKARFGNETVTLFCWKDVFVPLTAGNPPIDLGAYFPDIDFTKQYKPTEGNALWMGIVAPGSCGEYFINGDAWQAKIPLKVVFAEVNKTSTLNSFKIKLNIRVNSTLVWTVECKTVQETGVWNSTVLKKHLPNYVFSKQYCPSLTGNTVWAAY